MVCEAVDCDCVAALAAFDDVAVVVQADVDFEDVAAAFEACYRHGVAAGRIAVLPVPDGLTLWHKVHGYAHCFLLPGVVFLNRLSWSSRILQIQYPRLN